VKRTIAIGGYPTARTRVGFAYNFSPYFSRCEAGIELAIALKYFSLAGKLFFSEVIKLHQSPSRMKIRRILIRLRHS